MTSETSIVATRIADCVVLSVPDDLSGGRLRQLDEMVRRCAASRSLRAMVFDMAALKYADVTEFGELMSVAETAAILGVQPLMAGLNPGIVIHLVEAGAHAGRVRTFLDLADALTALGLTVGTSKP